MRVSGLKIYYKAKYADFVALRFKEDLRTSHVPIDAHLVRCHGCRELHMRPPLTIKADTEDKYVKINYYFEIVNAHFIFCFNFTIPGKGYT